MQSQTKQLNSTHVLFEIIQISEYHRKSKVHGMNRAVKFNKQATGLSCYQK